MKGGTFAELILGILLVAIGIVRNCTIVRFKDF